MELRLTFSMVAHSLFSLDEMSRNAKKPHVDAVSGQVERPEDPVFAPVRELWDGMKIP